MIPIRPHGRLYGTVEMGQGAAFDGAAIAKAEGFVRVVQQKMEAADWASRDDLEDRLNHGGTEPTEASRR
jgi:hypothetical protein